MGAVGGHVAAQAGGLPEKRIINKEHSTQKELEGWSSHCGTAETNLTRNQEVAGSIPGLAQWVKDLALL